MVIMTGKDRACSELAKVFGLDPDKTMKMNIGVYPNEVVTLTATMRVGEGELVAFMDALKKYNLTEVI